MPLLDILGYSKVTVHTAPEQPLFLSNSSSFLTLNPPQLNIDKFCNLSYIKYFSENFAYQIAEETFFFKIPCKDFLPIYKILFFYIT